MNHFSFNYDNSESCLENLNKLDIKNPQMFNPIHNKFFILTNNQKNGNIGSSAYFITLLIIFIC